MMSMPFIEQSFYCLWSDRLLFVNQSISLSSKFLLMFVERLFFGASDGGRQAYCFSASVWDTQVKAIASRVEGLLEEALGYLLVGAL